MSTSHGSFSDADARAAISHDLDTTLVVEAAAGTGKTTELVKRILRGSVDLIEHDPVRDVLRVTDHKTGRNRSTPDLIVGGGAVLQPVLYSLAVERGLGKKVVAGRLFYSTTAGGFVDHEIQLDDYKRGQGLQVLAVIDRAVEMGFLPAAPGDRACGWCDFQPICGPREEERVRRKAADKLADLTALRAMR